MGANTQARRGVAAVRIVLALLAIAMSLVILAATVHSQRERQLCKLLNDWPDGDRGASALLGGVGGESPSPDLLIMRGGDGESFFLAFPQPERFFVAELVREQIQTTRGEVVAVDYIASRPRARFEASVRDGDDVLSVVWFNGGYLRRLVHPGMTIRLRGRVRFFRGIPQMANPKWEKIDPSAPTIDSSALSHEPVARKSVGTRSPSHATSRSIGPCAAGPQDICGGENWIQL